MTKEGMDIGGDKRQKARHWAKVAARLFLGGVLAGSGLAKVFHPGVLAEVAMSYPIFPESLLRAAVAVLPPLELFLGLLVLLGLWLLPAAYLALFVATAFVFTNVVNLALLGGGDCGCFGSVISLGSGWSIVINLGMLAAGFLIIWAGPAAASPRLSDRVNRAAWFAPLLKSVTVASVLVGSMVLAQYNPLAPPVPAEGLPVAAPRPALRDTEMDRAVLAGLEAGRPALVYFYLDNCNGCKRQKPVLDRLEREYGERVTFVRVSGDDREARSIFGVTGFPRIFLIEGVDAGGYISRELRRYQPPEVLKPELDDLLARAQNNR